ncbi:MAG: ribonuclease R [Firmicutes bacterium HGW-Firmicutes-3]|jgi:ribonuclease R|nr:MAG: ribonuclease R [Firmicutes bacterium HGW-Firmicutes-3]
MKIDQKEVLLDLFKDKKYRPLKLKELALLLNLSKNEKKELEQSLQALIQEDKVILTKRGKYMINDAPEPIIGRFVSHPKGFGFVVIEGQDDDIFIPAKYVNTAFHNDTVAIKLLKDSRGKRPEGEIVKVLERGKDTLVGLYEQSDNFGFVRADDKKVQKDIYIAKSNSMMAMKGHKVVVKVTDWGGEDRKPEGEIVEIIGHVDDPDTAILSIVKNLEIPTEFPDNVKKQILHIPTEVPKDAAEGRLDYRNIQTVTIDGEDAKDLDDAITIEKIEQGYRLGVHIADVSYYVKEGSAMDEEALNRSTSVYLVDRVIPMLPRQLSNGICSLNAGVDRLALSCIMDIDQEGKVFNYTINETIINVDERMSYTAVSGILEKSDPELTERYKDFIDMFHRMESLAAILRAKRKQRGSIDFDFPEAKVKLDEFGAPIEIYVYERNVATKIIEEFMLLANETVAEHYFWQEIPFVYRNHEEPDNERIQALGKFIYNFGYHIKGKEDVHPKEIQKLLIDIEGSKEEILISRLALRSMKQAKYEVDCEGHYGLAAKYYSHFTSPIRRYPDLQIHRIIKENLKSKMSDKRISHYKKILPDVTKQNSEYERRAETAERETIKLKKVEYMQRHIGEVFTGVISGVTGWGLYVELPNTIEGLVHVTALNDDYYVHDELKYMYVGERTKKIYALGDLINVKVERCNVEERNIDFSVSEEGPTEVEDEIPAV